MLAWKSIFAIPSLVAVTIVILLCAKRRKKSLHSEEKPAVPSGTLPKKVNCPAFIDSAKPHLFESDIPPHSLVLNSFLFLNKEVTKLQSVDLALDPCYQSQYFFLGATQQFVEFSSFAVFDVQFSLISPSVLPPTCELRAMRLQAGEDCQVSSLVRLHSTGSSSDGAHTPDSTAGSIQGNSMFPQGCFADPDLDIEEIKPEIFEGKVLPRVLIPSDIWAEAVDQNIWHESFMIPAHMGGVLIGRLGRNVRELKNLWQAEFSLSLCPDRQDSLLFKLSCPMEYRDTVMQWVTKRFRMRPSKTPIGNPNQLRRYLPLGEPTRVHVCSLYGQKDFFVSILDKEYERFFEVQSEINRDYKSLMSFRMQLCAPVTVGTVAVLPHDRGFARALILKVFTSTQHALYFLLDYGTFGVIELSELRKIKVKYMRTRFQAIHVSWAHSWPVYSDVPDLHILRTFFSSGKTIAQAVRMETCCRASVAFSEKTLRGSLTDILALACQSGLYLMNQLVIHPSRQTWLNGTNYPYYPPLSNEINYTNLVSFAYDDTSFKNGAVYAPSGEYDVRVTQKNQIQSTFQNGDTFPRQRFRKSQFKCVQLANRKCHPDAYNSAVVKPSATKTAGNGQRSAKGSGSIPSVSHVHLAEKVNDSKSKYSPKAC